MNQIRIGLAAGLLLGISGLTFAQEGGPEPKPPAQEEPRQETPKHQEEEAKPPKAEKQEKEERKQPKESKPEKSPQVTDKAQPAPAQHEMQGHARPAGKSAHIPDQKFKSSFGRPHSFAARQVIRTTTVVAGQTQFVYGGYTFIVLDPWPVEWLYTDDCYIDYEDDDYFLVDVLHPGIRIALFVQF